MDKLRALRTFIAIVDQGSLTAAAEALRSSLPVVVRALAGLEAQLGVRLLQRTTRRLALTAEGQLYLERARRIVSDVDEADRLLGVHQAEPAGLLRVTAPVLFGQHHVAPAVNRFVLRHPGVQVELQLLDRVVDLVEEGLDIGIRIGHLQDSTLVAQRVGQIRRVIAASPAFLRRQGVPRHPRELAAANCLCSMRDGGQWEYADQGRLHKVAVAGPLRSNLIAPLLEAAAQGLGFVRCLSYQAAPLLAARRLRLVLVPFEIEPWPVNITYASARLLPLRTRVFVEALKAELQQAL